MSKKTKPKKLHDLDWSGIQTVKIKNLMGGHTMKVVQLNIDKKWGVAKKVRGSETQVRLVHPGNRFDTRQEAEEEIIRLQMVEAYWKAEDAFEKLIKLNPAKYENSTVGEQCN